MTISSCTHRKAEGPPKLLDEHEQALRQQERQALFKDYRAKRQAILQVRNEDREKRNEMKTQQLELAEQWQVRTESWVGIPKPPVN